MADTPQTSSNPTLIIPRANITKIYHSKKSDVDYLTVTDGENEFNLCAGDLDLSRVKKLVPLRIEAEISAFVFGKNQMLKCLSFKAEQVS